MKTPILQKGGVAAASADGVVVFANLLNRVSLSNHLAGVALALLLFSRRSVLVKPICVVFCVPSGGSPTLNN
jgi:hypothetical protein